MGALVIADDPLHGQHEQVPPHGHDRARRHVQAADVDDTQDVITVIDAPVLVAGAEIPAFAGTDVPVPHAQDPRREREVHHGPGLIRRVDLAVGEDRGLGPVVHALPDGAAKRDGGAEEDSLASAALLRGGRGQRAQGRDRRQGRVADQLGIAEQLARVMAESAGALIECALLRRGQPVGCRSAAAERGVETGARH